MRRLTFSVNNGMVSLIGDQTVDITPQLADISPQPTEIWLEVRDSTKRTTSSHAIKLTLSEDLETFTEEPDKNLGRLPWRRSEDAFSVLIPDDANAETVHIVKQQSDQNKAGEASSKRELASFHLSKKGGPNHGNQ